MPPDSASGCVATNNTEPCDDANVCTTNDACSDGSCQGDPVAPLTEVENVLMLDQTTMIWGNQGPGVMSDVASGLLTTLISDGGTSAAQCLENDHPTSEYTDSRPAPASNEGYYYMIRSQDTCSTGTYGFASSGA